MGEGRSDTCESCGAGKHWECRSTCAEERVWSESEGIPQRLRRTDSSARSTPLCWLRRPNDKPRHKRQDWLVRREQWEPGPEEIAEAVEEGMGILDPLDGSFIAASELLGTFRNYGRKRSSSGRGGWKDLDVAGQERDEFLAGESKRGAEGGWSVRNLGTTGNPRGRPKTGVQRPDLILNKTVELTHHPEFKAYVQGILSTHVGPIPISQLEGETTSVMISLQLEHGINASALAEWWRLTTRTGRLARQSVYRRAKAGREVRQKSPKGGRDEIDMTTEEVYSAVREGVRDGILDAQGDLIIRAEGHPVEEAERILEDEDAD